MRQPASTDGSTSGRNDGTLTPMNPINPLYHVLRPKGRPTITPRLPPTRKLGAISSLLGA
jgi:hypothetical protein